MFSCFTYQEDSSQIVLYSFNVLTALCLPNCLPNPGEVTAPFYYKSSHSAIPEQSGMECRTGFSLNKHLLSFYSNSHALCNLHIDEYSLRLKDVTQA